jgi:hypothetical protein
LVELVLKALGTIVELVRALAVRKLRRRAGRHRERRRRRLDPQRADRTGIDAGI